MYYLNEKGERVCTLKVHPTTTSPLPRFATRRDREAVDAEAAIRLRASASPPRSRNCPRRFPHAVGASSSFSPDDKFSKQRVACKKRFGLFAKPIEL